MFEQDYLLRLVKQLAALVGRVIGLRGRDEEVVREVDAACGDLLGLPPGALDRLDGATIAGLLRDPELMRQMAELVDEEAAALERLGRAAPAARRRQIAADLRSAAARV